MTWLIGFLATENILDVEIVIKLDAFCMVLEVPGKFSYC